MIIKVSDTIYLKFNEATKTTETIDLTELQERKEFVEVRIAQLNDYSDDALLAWAKRVYPLENEQRELTALENEIAKINSTIGEINGD
jgi:hypothetical protein